MTTITTRVVKTRDAATSILRKLGLKPNSYGLFMKKLDDGRFEVDLPKVFEQGYGVKFDQPKPGDAAARKPVKAKAKKILFKSGQKVTLKKFEKEPEQDATILQDVYGDENAIAVSVKPESKTDDGIREITIDQIKTPKPKTVKAPKEPKAKQEPKARRVSVSSVAEELLLAGKTNEEVFAVLKEKFKLDDSKKNYPSWYRCRLKRQKKLAEEKS